MNDIVEEIKAMIRHLSDEDLERIQFYIWSETQERRKDLEEMEEYYNECLYPDTD